MPSDIRPFEKIIIDPEKRADLAEFIEGALDIRTDAAHNAIPFLLQQLDLLERKQRDYGPRNISGFGTFGILVRMNDKFERLKTLFGAGKRRRARIRESITDTLTDLGNYSLIARMVEAGAWPTAEKPEASK